MEDGQREEKVMLINFQTKHTESNEQPSKTQKQRLSLLQSEDLKAANPNTQMRRSTQAYYDSELQKNQNRSRKDSNRSRESYLVQKNPRMFKQELVFMQNQNKERQFFTIWVAQKESSSGIFSHERFFLIDSQTQSMRYYSDVPELPLTSIQGLKEPKGVVYLNLKNKVRFTPNASKVGEVELSWFDQEGRKEWHLTMGNKKMVRELGVLIQNIRKNQYSGLRQMKKIIAETTQLTNRSRVKTETRFISEIKELESQRSNRNSIDLLRWSGRRDSPKTGFKAIQFKNLKKDESGISYSSKKQEQKFEQEIKPTKPSVRKNKKVEESLRNNKFAQKNEEQREIRMDEIMKSAHQQFEALSQKSQKQRDRQTSVTADPRKQLTSLQKILKKRRNTEILSYQPFTEHAPINMSKVMVKKINERDEEKQVKQQITIKPKSPVILNSSTKRDKYSREELFRERVFSSKYMQNEKMNRMALLEERRQTYAAMTKSKTHHLDKKLQGNASGLSKLILSRSKLQQNQQWLIQWLQASSPQELASIYNNFVDLCVDYVSRVVQKMSDWHLFHRPNSDQYTLSQDSVDYTYFMFMADEQEAEMVKRQKELLEQFQGANYLLSCLKHKETNMHNPSFPLSCVVSLKGIKVFCSATAISDKISIKDKDIKQKYSMELSEIQRTAKISLQVCQLQELTVNGKEYLYFSRTNVLPKLTCQAHLDEKYIFQFIKEGIIRSNIDGESIQTHIKQDLLPLCLCELQNGVLSRTEFISKLCKYGLNESFILLLWQRSTKNEHLHRASELILSEILSLLMQQHIRQCIHNFTQSHNTSKQIEEIIFRQIRNILKENKTIDEVLSMKLKDMLKQMSWKDLGEINESYLLTSLFERLGIRADIKYRMDLQELEGRTFWKQVQFNSQNFNISFRHQTLIYGYEAFNSHFQLLQKEVLSKQEIVNESQCNLNRQNVLSMINHKHEGPYQQSYLFKLMDKQQKIKINHFLAYSQKPNKKCHRPPFAEEDNQIYFNFKYHPTAFVVNYQHFSLNLIGIRWLIREKNYQEAEEKLNQLFHRVFIWCKDQTNLIVQLYDMKCSLSLIMKKQHQSLTASLKALKCSIKYFQSRNDVSWQFVWERAFQAAKVHLQFEKYEKALEFYESCEGLVEKATEQQLKNLQMNHQFIEIYHKKALICMLLCKIDQTLLICHTNLKKYKYLLDLFQAYNIELVFKLLKLELETYLLLFRCLQITNNYQQMLKKVGLCLAKYLQKEVDMGQSSVGDLNEFGRYRFVELAKYAWLALVYNTSSLNSLDSQLPKATEINLTQIANLLKSIALHPPRYTLQQIVRHFTKTMRSYVQPDQSHGKIQGSYYLTHMVKIFHEVSLQKNEQRCTIYDDNCEKNPFLFLQCFASAISYEFAIGTIQMRDNWEVC